MNIDSVITLENNVNCLLLEKVEYQNKNYFMSVLLNEEEEPSDEYVVFEEERENDDIFVVKIEDAELLTELLKLFTTKANNLVANLPEEV